MSAKICKL